MKQLLLIPITLMLFVNASSQTDHSLFTTDTIPVIDAVDHIGAYRTFCDELVTLDKFDNMDGKPTMMRLGNASPGITLVIWEGDAKKFDQPLDTIFSKGDKVCVTGQISSYGGNPRLEVGTPRQIHKVE